MTAELVVKMNGGGGKETCGGQQTNRSGAGKVGLGLI